MTHSDYLRLLADLCDQELSPDVRVPVGVEERTPGLLLRILADRIRGSGMDRKTLASGEKAA